MKHLITTLALAAGSVAHANNNEQAAQCMLYGVVTGKTELSKDAFKLADNPRAANIIAEVQMHDTMKQTTDKDALAAKWIDACTAIGLRPSSYAVTPPPKPSKPKREPTADELRMQSIK